SALGTHRRTVTEGNAYTLAAAQDYMVGGTTVASGSDTYWLHSSDTTAAHDDFAGSASGGNHPLFNGAGSAQLGGPSPRHASSLTHVDDAGYAVDRIVTSGYSWSQGRPVGVAVDARFQAGVLAANQVLSVANTAQVTVNPTTTRSLQLATLVATNADTQIG